jgi:hypothetical protein
MLDHHYQTNSSFFTKLGLLYLSMFQSFCITSAEFFAGSERNSHWCCWNVTLQHKRIARSNINLRLVKLMKKVLKDSPTSPFVVCWVNSVSQFYCRCRHISSWSSSLCVSKTNRLSTMSRNTEPSSISDDVHLICDILSKDSHAVKHRLKFANACGVVNLSDTAQPYLLFRESLMEALNAPEKIQKLLNIPESERKSFPLNYDNLGLLLTSQSIKFTEAAGEHQVTC